MAQQQLYCTWQQTDNMQASNNWAHLHVKVLKVQQQKQCLKITGWKSVM